MNQTKIYDVAGAAGVSLATVSRVLNHPEKVKEATRDKVLRIIKEKGYKPNANARGLASRRSTTVAVVVPNISRSSVAEMIQGIVDAAKEYGYTIRLFVSEESSSQIDMWGDVIASSVDGVLFMNDQMTSELYKQLELAPVPVVFVNSISERKGLGGVRIDYEEAAYKITKEMINRGNKSIMFIKTGHKYSVNEMKEKGYIRAMNESKLTPDIVTSSGDIDINEVQFQEILGCRIPDVAMAVRDSIAISFMNIASKRGIKVPEQLQVIGFQNTRYALLSNPKLTCVAIPIYDIGNKAMSYLTQLMKNDDESVAKSEDVIVDYNIAWRESTR
ncbi:MAG: LacI family DNA-binding transcriptional regulator [Bacilli bacterium]|nr:LacI family DNA-binding transcriptional regulator [Bacilli bacterium]